MRLVVKKLEAAAIALCICISMSQTAFAGTWKEDLDGWRYAGTDGIYLVDEWVQIGGLWYYFDENGYMTVGWEQSGDKWYYMDQQGKMLSNTEVNGYRLGSDGAWDGDVTKINGIYAVEVKGRRDVGEVRGSSNERIFSKEFSIPKVGVAGNQAAADAINQYFTQLEQTSSQMEEQMKAEAREAFAKSPVTFKESSLKVLVTPVFSDGKVLSFHIKQTVNHGTAETSREMGVNFDVSTGKQIDLEAIVKDKEGFELFVINSIESQMKAKAMEGVNFEKAQKTLQSYNLLDLKWIWSKNQLEFLFDFSETSEGGDEGTVSILIPKLQFMSYFNEYGRKLCESNSMG